MRLQQKTNELRYTSDTFSKPVKKETSISDITGALEVKSLDMELVHLKFRYLSQTMKSHSYECYLRKN